MNLRWIIRHAIGALPALLAAVPAFAHTPLFVIVDTAPTPPRLRIAPGSLTVLDGEVVLNFAPSGPYADQFVTDLPGYDATLFPFSQFPGAQLRLQRLTFPPLFGMYGAIGSTTPILTGNGDMIAFTGHTHYVHFADAPDLYRPIYRYVDASGALMASAPFTVTFRAGQSDLDSDNDGVPDDVDNCVTTANLDQIDSDLDTVGDDCDCCPFVANRDQADLDADGRCDACNCGGEPCPPGDATHDAAVDLLDLIGARNVRSPNLFPPAPADTLRFDVDGDGDIDLNDLSTIRFLMF